MCFVDKQDHTQKFGIEIRLMLTSSFIVKESFVVTIKIIINVEHFLSTLYYRDFYQRTPKNVKNVQVDSGHQKICHLDCLLCPIKDVTFQKARERGGMKVIVRFPMIFFLKRYQKTRFKIGKIGVDTILPEKK